MSKRIIRLNESELRSLAMEVARNVISEANYNWVGEVLYTKEMPYTIIDLKRSGWYNDFEKTNDALRLIVRYGVAALKAGYSLKDASKDAFKYIAINPNQTNVMELAKVIKKIYDDENMTYAKMLLQQVKDGEYDDIIKRMPIEMDIRDVIDEIVDRFEEEEDYYISHLFEQGAKCDAEMKNAILDRSGENDPAQLSLPLDEQIRREIRRMLN